MRCGILFLAAAGDGRPCRGAAPARPPCGGERAAPAAPGIVRPALQQRPAARRPPPALHSSSMCPRRRRRRLHEPPATSPQSRPATPHRPCAAEPNTIPPPPCEQPPRRPVRSISLRPRPRTGRRGGRPRLLPWPCSEQPRLVSTGLVSRSGAGRRGRGGGGSAAPAPRRTLAGQSRPGPNSRAGRPSAAGTARGAPAGRPPGPARGDWRHPGGAAGKVRGRASDSESLSRGGRRGAGVDWPAEPSQGRGHGWAEGARQRARRPGPAHLGRPGPGPPGRRLGACPRGRHGPPARREKAGPGRAPPAGGLRASVPWLGRDGKCGGRGGWRRAREARRARARRRAGYLARRICG